MSTIQLTQTGMSLFSFLYKTLISTLYFSLPLALSFCLFHDLCQKHIDLLVTAHARIRTAISEFMGQFSNRVISCYFPASWVRTVYFYLLPGTDNSYLEMKPFQTRASMPFKGQVFQLLFRIFIVMIQTRVFSRPVHYSSHGISEMHEEWCRLLCSAFQRWCWDEFELFVYEISLYSAAAELVTIFIMC